MDIAALLQGRNPYGRAGGNLANIIAQSQASNARNIDPRLGAMGFGVRDNGMDENPTLQFQQFNNQNDWNTGGERTINGQRYLQLGDFFQNGRNVNPDDIQRLVKDPSQIQYDDLGGLVTPYDNFIGLTPDDFGTQLVRGGIAAAGLGGTAAGIGNAFFGTPNLTSLLGGGSSSSGLLGSGPPPLEGAPSLTSGTSAASTAAQQALPGLTQSGIMAPGGGAMVPGMSHGGGLLGAGSFDSGGWSGTGINGNTGVRGPLDRFMYNVRGFTNNPVGWAMNNPVDAIRGASSVYNLGSSIFGGGSQPQQRQSGKPSGTQTGNAPNLAPQFYQNQTTLAQLAQLYGGR